MCNFLLFVLSVKKCFRHSISGKIIWFGFFYLGYFCLFLFIIILVCNFPRWNIMLWVCSVWVYFEGCHTCDADHQDNIINYNRESRIPARWWRKYFSRLNQISVKCEADLYPTKKDASNDASFFISIRFTTVRGANREVPWL